MPRPSRIIGIKYSRARYSGLRFYSTGRAKAKNCFSTTCELYFCWEKPNVSECHFGAISLKQISPPHFVLEHRLGIGCEAFDFGQVLGTTRVHPRLSFYKTPSFADLTTTQGSNGIVIVVTSPILSTSLYSGSEQSV